MIQLKNKRLYIILSVIALTLAMNSVDAILKPPYAVKSLIKVLLFLIVPLIFFLSNKADTENFKKLFVLRKNGLLLAGILGVLCFGAILGSFFLLKGHFDFSGITKSLTGDSAITANNFIYVALYISFCNSFLEEFFFRGYAFITLKKYTGRTFAYIFSSLLFAFYHVGMTLGWLQFAVFVIELAGLAIGGIIFNYLDESTETVYPSWLIHMFCNFGINTIGFMLFGMM